MITVIETHEPTVATLQEWLKTRQISFSQYAQAIQEKRKRVLGEITMELINKPDVLDWNC